MSDLVVREPEVVSLGLFGTSDPVEVVARASRIATTLAKVVNERKLYAIVNGRKFPTVEGWTLLGGMLGAFAHTEWVRPVKDDNGATIGYHARVVVRTLNGNELGAAEAMCIRGESKQWGQDAKDFALMSMAQTRATSKAMANPLRWVFKLAGYEGAAAEEMGGVTQDGEVVNPSAESLAAVQGAQDASPTKKPTGQPAPPASFEPVKRGPGRPRKDGTPPQAKRTNVVPAPKVAASPKEPSSTTAIPALATTKPDDGEELYLESVRTDVRFRAALLYRLNILVKNQNEDRILGREATEIVPAAKPHAGSDAALATMIGRVEFFPGKSLGELDGAELQQLSDTIEQFIAKRKDQLTQLGIKEDAD